MKLNPKTLISTVRSPHKSERPELFEPALRHFTRAFRLGDPVIPDPEQRDEWHKARRQVIDHILTLIHRTQWNEHLVLRGSLLLKAWMGDSAREPGDIDWVFRPTDEYKSGPMAQRFFKKLLSMVSDSPHTANATIETSRISEDDIWTYDRASGRRILFPWKAEGLPGGEVQMDIVFREELLSDPILTHFPLVDGGSIPLWSANKELSLAWKILWLETDTHPQGKDLYDAVLLAEDSALPLELLQRVLTQFEDWKFHKALDSYLPFTWEVDWKTFKDEYPWVEGELMDWQLRLSIALSSTFAGG